MHFLEGFGQEKGFLSQKQCFLGTITWYMLHFILIRIWKFVITRQNDAFVAKIAKMHLTRFCMAIFALAEGQGCIIRSILSSRMGAHGVSSEHVENMEMFSCSLT